MRACEVQKAFNEGLGGECDRMNSHPFCTYKVERFCGSCEVKRRRMERTMSKLKLAVKDMKESIKRLQKGSGSELSSGSCETESQSD